MKKRKSIVVFYSRSGNTKKIAEKIAKILNSGIDEIIDLKDRSGIVGWLVAGKDATMNKITEIKNKINPEKYDLIVVGTPVWAWTSAPAVRAYLKKYNLKNNKSAKLAFFCTEGSSQTKAFKDMEALSKKPLAVLEIKERDLDSSDNLIEDFCRKIRKG